MFHLPPGIMMLTRTYLYRAVEIMCFEIISGLLMPQSLPNSPLHPYFFQMVWELRLLPPMLDLGPAWLLASTIASNKAFSCRMTQDDMVLPRISGYSFSRLLVPHLPDLPSVPLWPSPRNQLQAICLVLTFLQPSPRSSVR